MWKRKKSNFLIILEIFLSCFILFLLIAFIGYRYNNYSEPLGFSYDNIISLEISPEESSADSLKGVVNKVVARLKSMPEIQDVTLSKNAIPFKYGSTHEVELTVGPVSEKVFQWDADDKFKDVMGLNILEGRWFKTQDNGLRAKSIVVNKAFQEKFFANGSAIDQKIEINKEPYVVVGLVDFYRKNLNDEIKPGFFLRYNAEDTTSTTGDILIRSKSGDVFALEEKLSRELNSVINPNEWKVNISSLSAYKEADLNENFSTVALNFIVYGFLIINIAMGLFGVLWNNINLRKSELGLRRAIGATSMQIYKQILGEVFVLTTFGVIPAFVLMIQFPLLNFLGFTPNVYITAIAVAIPIIYVFTTFCALYPSSQAAKIQPANALHEE
ncbi:ABC transporter permease [Pedobacter lusitanus]|nr:FtsX-like permease family protein [Pedobacter lusitanus]